MIKKRGTSLTECMDHPSSHMSDPLESDCAFVVHCSADSLFYCDGCGGCDVDFLRVCDGDGGDARDCHCAALFEKRADRLQAHSQQEAAGSVKAFSYHRLCVCAALISRCHYVLRVHHANYCPFDPNETSADNYLLMTLLYSSAWSIWLCLSLYDLKIALRLVQFLMLLTPSLQLNLGKNVIRTQISVNQLSLFYLSFFSLPCDGRLMWCNDALFFYYLSFSFH